MLEVAFAQPLALRFAEDRQATRIDYSGGTTCNRSKEASRSIVIGQLHIEPFHRDNPLHSVNSSGMRSCCIRKIILRSKCMEAMRESPLSCRTNTCIHCGKRRKIRVPMKKRRAGSYSVLKRSWKQLATPPVAPRLSPEGLRLWSFVAVKI